MSKYNNEPKPDRTGAVLLDIDLCPETDEALRQLQQAILANKGVIREFKSEGPGGGNPNLKAEFPSYDDMRPFLTVVNGTDEDEVLSVNREFDDEQGERQWVIECASTDFFFTFIEGR